MTNAATEADGGNMEIEKADSHISAATTTTTR
jgi:hypothetical protein